MATVIDGTDGDDLIVQNSKIELDVYTYGGDDEVVLNLVGKYGGFNDVNTGSGNEIVRKSCEGGNIN